MKIFDLSNNMNVVCNYKATRNGFKHTATMYWDGLTLATAKINYINRTWESYEYQTVLKKVVENGLKSITKNALICGKIDKKEYNKLVKITKDGFAIL